MTLGEHVGLCERTMLAGASDCERRARRRADSKRCSDSRTAFAQSCHWMQRREQRQPCWSFDVGPAAFQSGLCTVLADRRDARSGHYVQSSDRGRVYDGVTKSCLDYPQARQHVFGLAVLMLLLVGASSSGAILELGLSRSSWLTVSSSSVATFTVASSMVTHASLSFSVALAASDSALPRTCPHRYILMEFDSTLGFPGEGPGDRVSQWDVSLQPDRKQVASCRVCSNAFMPNELRAHSHSDSNRRCYYHLHCIEGGLGPLASVHGYDQLPQASKLIVDKFVDREGAVRAEYLEAKRRRRQQDPLDGGAVGSGLLPGVGGSAEDAEKIDFSDLCLRHLEWWDHIAYADALGLWVPTIAAVPEPNLLAVADARTAVLVAARDATGVQEERFYKLLAFMDRRLFAQPVASKGRKDKLCMDNIIASRLRCFWRGDWERLWRDAAALGSQRRVQQVSGSVATLLEAEVHRIETLLRNGEESRAASCISRASKIATGHDTADCLSRLFPASAAGPSGTLPSEAVDGPELPEFRTKLQDTIQKQLLRYPRLSSPGPSGSRFEHWGSLRYNPEGMSAAGVVLTKLALGEGPADAMDAMLSG